VVLSAHRQHKGKKMEKLKLYLKTLSASEKVIFAENCETSLGYLRKAISIKQKLSAELSIRIEIESNGIVTADDLRSDINWNAIRAQPIKPTSEPVPPIYQRGIFKGYPVEKLIK
jgi:DNA-binding transcriptional regulator YdaS (Cro superfamily)